MTNQLVIAEKPSVGMAYAAILGAKTRKPGYVEGNGYIVSWCFGHLTTLAGADSYDPRYHAWIYEDLPILPDPWQHKIPKDKYKQFETLKKLMHRSDVSEVINACDAGREGELIFRNAYHATGCTKPVKRLWLSSMEDDAIREGFRTLKDGADYDNLFAAAECRAKADWLVGINATRLFSILYHRTLHVGRVVSPTLALLVAREAEIDAFVPVPYYTAQLHFGSYTAVSEKFPTREQAESAAAASRGSPVVVVQVDRDERHENPPPLYDLTTLQRDANRLFGFTAQQTLDYLQALYEKKLCTYPRTDSRFLTDDMRSSVPEIVGISAHLHGVDQPMQIRAQQVCDSKKVSDHHAILPTVNAGKDLSLPSGEAKILRLLAHRMLCATGDRYEYTATTVTFDCGGTHFTAKGKVTRALGWKQFLKEHGEDTALPDLTEGDVLQVFDYCIKDGQTTPPKHYSEDTLLSAMETAGKDAMPDDAERKGLGTPATRAGMIEKLISTGLVTRQKAAKSVQLIPTRTGFALATVLPEQLQSPMLTADWEHQLDQIAKGQLSPASFLTDIQVMVTKLVQTYQVIAGAEVLFPSDRPVVGKCPRCGSDVTESRKGFFCERAECQFGLWRDNKFLSPKKIELTRDIVSPLLTGGRVNLTNIWSEKTGKRYSATLVLTDDGERTRYNLEFPER